MCEVISKQSSEVENIKKFYSEYRDQFALLKTEVANCARQIKIWIAISNAKGEFGALAYESFFGWVQQYSLLRLIAIESLKIFDDSKKFLIAILNKILPDDAKKLLIKNSRIQGRLDKLEILVVPLRSWRNKRYAHLENVEVDSVKCNMQDLFLALVGLDHSICYITHYLLNPIYIVKNEYVTYDDAELSESSDKLFLERYLDNDPTLQECIKMIEALNIEH